MIRRVLKKYKAIFISPHLDDAVFSCGAEIARLREIGEVLVINVFTQFLARANKANVSIGPERYEEERAASQALNFDSINLNELDAFFRENRFQSVGNIFLSLQKNDFDYLEILRKKIQQCLEQFDFEKIYVPIGVGWHIDHQLCFLAFSNSKYQNEIIYYEDAPYCLMRGATDLRLNEIGQLDFGSLTLKAWWHSSLAFWKSGMVQKMRPSVLRYLSFPFTSLYIFRLLRSHSTRQRFFQTKKLTPTTRELGSFFSKKLKGISQYTTQVKEFFVNSDQMKSAYTAYSHTADPSKEYTERFWSPEH
jgi:hypothetical protein